MMPNSCSRQKRAPNKVVSKELKQLHELVGKGVGWKNQP
jgi:hypothetical protein